MEAKGYINMPEEKQIEEEGEIQHIVSINDDDDEDDDVSDTGDEYAEEEKVTTHKA